MKICTSCEKKWGDTEKYCPRCNRYLGNVESISEEDYYRNNPVNRATTEPIIECPYCHSTDTKKISGLSKAGSVALFGIFAMGKVSKQWHCNNCNSDF